MSKMLNVKDLITVGIFAVILTVSIFIFGMLGISQYCDCIAGHCSINCRNSIYAVFNKS